MFNTSNWRLSYHQLPIKDVDIEQKIVLWGVDEHGKDHLYQWKILIFGLKNMHV
jgi:hypothetical protein